MVITIGADLEAALGNVARKQGVDPEVLALSCSAGAFPRRLTPATTPR